MRMRSLLLPLLLVASAQAVAGHSVHKARAQVVNSLSVAGTIEIDPQGKVMSYAIAHPEAYSQAVRDLLDRNVPHWIFNPVLVDGVASPVRADMYLRLQATPVEGDTYRIEVASAAFGGNPGKRHAAITARDRVPPKYPFDENLYHVGGQVVLVAMVGPTGKVEDAAVQQTDLHTLGTESQLNRWRRDFERQALAAIRQWTFDVPATGEAAGQRQFVRIPVLYIPEGETAPVPGNWESYIPGPRHSLPWDKSGPSSETADAGSDALPGGGVFPLHQELQLQTPLNAG